MLKVIYVCFSCLVVAPELYAPDRSVCIQTGRPRIELWPWYSVVVMDCPALVLGGFGNQADRPSTRSTDLCRNCGQGDVYVCFAGILAPGRQT